MSLIDRLKSFNRKERFILLHHVLGYEGESFRLGDRFRGELARTIGVGIPEDAFVAMDYHIDWLQMAISPIAGIVPNLGLVHGNQEDIDLLIAFDAGGRTHVVLVEAKGDTSWSNRQLRFEGDEVRTHLRQVAQRNGPRPTPLRAHVTEGIPPNPHNRLAGVDEERERKAAVD